MTIICQYFTESLMKYAHYAPSHWCRILQRANGKVRLRITSLGRVGEYVSRNEYKTFIGRQFQQCSTQVEAAIKKQKKFDVLKDGESAKQEVRRCGCGFSLCRIACIVDPLLPTTNARSCVFWSQTGRRKIKKWHFFMTLWCEIRPAAGEGSLVFFRNT